MNTETRYANFFQILGDATKNSFAHQAMEKIGAEGSNEEVVDILAKSDHNSKVDHVVRVVQALLTFYSDRRWGLIQAFVDRFNLEMKEDGWNPENKKIQVSSYCALGFSLGLLRWANYDSEISSEDDSARVAQVIVSLILAKNSSFDFFPESSHNPIRGYSEAWEEGVKMNSTGKSRITEELSKFLDDKYPWPTCTKAKKILIQVNELAREDKELTSLGKYILEVVCYFVLRRKYSPLGMTNLLVSDNFGEPVLSD